MKGTGWLAGVVLGAALWSSGGGTPALAAETLYGDVSNSHWAYNAIADLTERGVTQGDDGNFFPNKSVTRAEFAKMLVTSLNVPLRQDKPQDFVDVQGAAWYYPYVETAFQAGIVHGTDSTHFQPNGVISRQDMVVMLVNALHLQKMPDSLVPALLPFYDKGGIAPYAESSVAMARELQVVSGNPDGSFAPSQSSSRAAAAVVVDRMLTLRTDKVQALQAADFHPQAHVAVNVTPSPFLQAGQPAQVNVQVLDSNNNLATLTAPVNATVTLSDPTLGSVSSQSVTIPTSGQVALTLTAAVGVSGDAILTATPSSADLSRVVSGSERVSVFQQASDLVKGKGMWMMWSDWANNNTDQQLQKAKQNGITHLFIEVATSYHNQGFYGPDALEGLIHKAHQQHMTVFAWTYAGLANPTAEAADNLNAARFVTTSGERADGLAPDLEETSTVNATSVTTFSTALRNGLGTSYPLVLCTYPPQSRPNFPWKTFAQYYDVVAPMDYWHYYARPYTYSQAYSYVATSIQQIHQYAGRADWPVTVIGQGYDMFSDQTGAQSPSPDEIRGSMDAARNNGAVGYSLYRYGTLTSPEWQAFGAYVWY